MRGAGCCPEPTRVEPPRVRDAMPDDLSSTLALGADSTVKARTSMVGVGAVHLEGPGVGIGGTSWGACKSDGGASVLRKETDRAAVRGGGAARDCSVAPRGVVLISVEWVRYSESDSSRGMVSRLFPGVRSRSGTLDVRRDGDVCEPRVD